MEFFLWCGYDSLTIKDSQDVLTRQYSLGLFNLYSTISGPLLNDGTDRVWSSMNNKGDMTWIQYDPVTGVNQVYGLIDGVVTQVTFDSVQHYETSINDAGEIVWLQTDVGSVSDHIFSSKRGQVTNGCQSQLIPGMVWPKINNCGDVVFIAYDPEVGNKLFRLGNAAPCGSVPEPNDSQQTAVQIKDHSTNVGFLDHASSPVDWYRCGVQ